MSETNRGRKRPSTTSSGYVPAKRQQIVQPDPDSTKEESGMFFADNTRTHTNTAESIPPQEENAEFDEMYASFGGIEGQATNSVRLLSNAPQKFSQTTVVPVQSQPTPNFIQTPTEVLQANDPAHPMTMVRKLLKPRVTIKVEPQDGDTDWLVAVDRTERIKVFVGGAYNHKWVKRSVLEQSKVLQSWVIEDEEEAFIMRPELLKTQPKIFISASQFLHKGEFKPRLVPQTQNADSHGRPELVWEGIGSESGYALQLVKAAKIYNFAASFAIDGLQDHIFEKISSISPGKFSDKALLDAAGIVFSDIRIFRPKKDKYEGKKEDSVKEDAARQDGTDDSTKDKKSGENSIDAGPVIEKVGEENGSERNVERIEGDITGMTSDVTVSEDHAKVNGIDGDMMEAGDPSLHPFEPEESTAEFENWLIDHIAKRLKNILKVHLDLFLGTGVKTKNKMLLAKIFEKAAWYYRDNIEDAYYLVQVEEVPEE